MAKTFVVQSPAAGTETVVIAEWLVEEGSRVQVGDPLLLVETDKAAMEVETDIAGVLLRRLIPAGTEVAVGSPAALIGEEGEAVPDRAPEPAPQIAPAAPPAPAATASPVGGHARIFSSPLARNRARELGVDVAMLTGTGPGGRIVRRDVEAAAAARPVPSTPAPPPVPAGLVVAGEQVPHSRMRRAIAGALTASKQTVPHFYLKAGIRAERLLALREQILAVGAQRVSITDLLLKAAALAYRQVPEMNVRWTADSTVRPPTVDIAIAVATDGGLVTPVVTDAGRHSLTDLSEQVRELAARARSGKLRQDELVGGVMTISNLGMFGVQEFTAIINPPQSAILAVGGVVEQPVVEQGAVVAGKVINVVLSVDHRPLDGVTAARWMEAFVAIAGEPIRILLG